MDAHACHSSVCKLGKFITSGKDFNNAVSLNKSPHVNVKINNEISDHLIDLIRNSKSVNQNLPHHLILSFSAGIPKLLEQKYEY